MWTCPKCHEHVEDAFDVCWNCGTNPEGREDPNFVPDTDVPVIGDGAPDSSVLNSESADVGRSRPVCSDCGGRMYAIKLVDRDQAISHEGLRYTAADSEQSWMLGRFPIVGKVRSQMCSTCGRIQLFGVPQ